MARPSKYDKIDLEMVGQLARRGWTDDEMSAFFKVDRSNWYRWKAEKPEFRDALKEWKAEADARVERSLYERALGYSHPEDKILQHNGKPVIVPTIKHYAPDTTAAIFWLKNRQPEDWRDKVEKEITGPNGGPVQVTRIELVAPSDNATD